MRHLLSANHIGLLKEYARVDELGDVHRSDYPHTFQVAIMNSLHSYFCNREETIISKGETDHALRFLRKGEVNVCSGVTVGTRDEVDVDNKPHVLFPIVDQGSFLNHHVLRGPSGTAPSELTLMAYTRVEIFTLDVSSLLEAAFEHLESGVRLSLAEEMMKAIKRSMRLRIWGLKVLDGFTDIDVYDKHVLRLQVAYLKKMLSRVGPVQEVLPRLFQASLIKRPPAEQAGGATPVDGAEIERVASSIASLDAKVNAMQSTLEGRMSQVQAMLEGERAKRAAEIGEIEASVGRAVKAQLAQGFGAEMQTLVSKVRQHLSWLLRSFGTAAHPITPITPITPSTPTMGALVAALLEIGELSFWRVGTRPISRALAPRATSSPHLPTARRC